MPLQFMSLLSEDRWGTWHTFSFKALRKSKCFGTKQCYDDFVLDSLIYISLLVDVNKLSEMHLVHAKYKITIISNLVFVTSVITWVRVNTCYRNELLPYCKYVFFTWRSTIKASLFVKRYVTAPSDSWQSEL